MHLSSSPAIWYAARASGVAAYVVLSIVVALGLTLGKKAQSSRWPRFSIEEVHRFGGLLVGSLIGVHVLAIAIDSFLPFSLTQLLVPFTASYRPLWTGLGIAAAELLVALAITNHYRRRLPYRFWRRAHYLNFAVWAFASLHGLMGGTDRGAAWLAILYGLSVATVLTLLLWRFGGRTTRVVTAGAVTVVALPLLIVGPLGRTPPRRPLRRQLFLNFKGGTGKTSVSTSYAFRLAEMGHRVLVIDLDSQGHASKCLGVSGEEAERTLFEALIKKVPLEQIIVKYGLAENLREPRQSFFDSADPRHNSSALPHEFHEFPMCRANDLLHAAFIPRFGLVHHCRRNRV